MNRINKYLTSFILISVSVIFLAIAISSIPIRNNSIGVIADGYPPPNLTTSPTIDNTSYPAPPLVTPSIITEKPIVTSTSNNFLNSEPILATNIANKLAHTPSVSEIAALATDMYYKMNLPSEPPEKLATYLKLINSLNELPDYVYSDPFFYRNEQIYSTCLNVKNPGTVLAVKSLGDISDYYLLPFWKDGNVCGVALIFIEKGFASAGGWAEINIEKFPLLSANEAINQVKAKSVKEITETPLLVFGGYKEIWEPFNPAWQIKTIDGDLYYVITIHGVVEDGNQTTNIKVYKSSELNKNR